ncbi:MAG: AMIN-like domain-containing (lipo)protein, partial [Aquihabitans sp.]
SVRYHEVVREGIGGAIALRGNADLEVVAQAPAYGPNGTSIFRPANRLEVANVTGYETFRQVAYAGSFEGQTTFGLGVRTRLPFRVWAASDRTGTKLVVDVAHRWP